MAWIKMRSELQSHPKIVRILSATSSDKFRVVGGLHAVWSVFDQHSTDGTLFGYTPETMDHVIGWIGFSAALLSVGWLSFDGVQTLALPEFDEHNSKGAKRRAEDQKRKRNDRNDPPNVPQESGHIADKKRTREDKIREDNKDTPPAKTARSAIHFKTFLENCKANNEKPISSYKPVFDYADKAGISHDMIGLCWSEFYRRYDVGGGSETKKYADWRKTFRNCVESNWFKLWWLNPGTGQYELTSAGRTADKVAA